MLGYSQAPPCPDSRIAFIHLHLASVPSCYFFPYLSLSVPHGADKKLRYQHLTELLSHQEMSRCSGFPELEEARFGVGTDFLNKTNEH